MVMLHALRGPPIDLCRCMLQDLAFVLDDAPSATFGASPTSPSARGGSPTLDELAGFVRKCHESRPLLIADRGAAGSEAWFSSVVCGFAPATHREHPI